MTDEDVAVVAPVLTNDELGAGGSLAGVTVTAGAVGAAILGDDVVVTPAADWWGTAQVRYELCDAHRCDEAALTVDVAPVPDPPTAGPVGVTTDEDTPVTIDLGGVIGDPDGDLDLDSLGITVPPGNGTATALPDGRLHYVPALDHNGADGFTYRICDLTTQCASAAVSVTVDPVNDPPVAVADVASATGSAPVSVTVAVLDNDDDPDVGDRALLEVTAVTPPGVGAVVTDGRTITYTSADPGIESFTYTVCDPGGLCDSATVHVQVIIDPVVTDDAAVTEQGAPVIIPIADNDGGLLGGLLDLSTLTVGNAAHGTTAVVAGGIRYTPDDDFVGVDAFDYTVCDVLVLFCSTATVTVQVVAPPSPPTAVDDVFVVDASAEDVPLDVLANDHDPDGDLDPESLELLTTPAAATAMVDGWVVRYTPTSGPEAGVQSFVYEICDHGGRCATATVEVAHLGDDDGFAAAAAPAAPATRPGDAAPPAPFTRPQGDDGPSGPPPGAEPPALPPPPEPPPTPSPPIAARPAPIVTRPTWGRRGGRAA